jgi:predicted phosphodiesterase
MLEFFGGETFETGEEAERASMRIAIISDIHGNCIGLDAVLNDLQRARVDQLVCLGDAIQGGPQPALVAARLRELGQPVVMGNADAWLLTGEESGQEKIPNERHRKMNAVRDWSLSQLSPVDRAYIQSFRPTVEIPFETGGALLCFHGSPASFDDVILPDISHEELNKTLGAQAGRVMAGGHTHIQFMRRIGKDGRFFFNPGSAGFAYSHHQPDEGFQADPWAEYAILTIEGEALALEFRRVPFDVAALLEVYRSSGRPHAEGAIAQYSAHKPA